MAKEKTEETKEVKIGSPEWVEKETTLDEEDKPEMDVEEETKVD